MADVGDEVRAANTAPASGAGDCDDATVVSKRTQTGLVLQTSRPDFSTAVQAAQSKFVCPGGYEL